MYTAWFSTLICVRVLTASESFQTPLCLPIKSKNTILLQYDKEMTIKQRIIQISHTPLRPI